MLELIPEQYHTLYNTIITLLPTITALAAQIITFIITIKKIFAAMTENTKQCTDKCNELMSGNDIKELKALVSEVIEENKKLKDDYKKMIEICTRVKLKKEQNLEESKQIHENTNA